MKLSDGLTWKVKDGCEIRNVYLENPTMKSIEAWSGMDKATKTIRMVARRSLPDDLKELVPLNNMLPVNFEALKDNLDEETFNKLKNHETEKLNRILVLLEQNEYSSDAIDMETLNVDWTALANQLDVGDSLDDILDYTVEKKSSPLGKIVSEVKKYSGTFNVTFSRNQLSDDRDIKAKEEVLLRTSFTH